MVGEGAFALDLDDRDPLAVPRLELGVAGDIDLAQVELDFVPELAEDAACPITEMAALRGVEDDVRDYG